MIERMKFLSITGPKADIDRVIEAYVSKYEIHLENALSELRAVKGLRPYIEINPYKDAYQRSEELFAALPEKAAPPPGKKVSLDEALEIIQRLDGQVGALDGQKKELASQAESLKASLDKVFPFTGLNYDLRSILHFRYIKFRFGRISHEYYDKFASYVYDSIDTVLYKCREDENYVWGVYFVPSTLADKIGAIYSSMHFETFYLPDEYEGTPLEAIHSLQDKITAIKDSIAQLDAQAGAILTENQEDLVAAHHKLETFSTNFNVRKLAACTKQKINTFYILCGWMSEGDAKAFQHEIENDSQTFCIVEEDHGNVLSKPPTKLSNPGLFRPFELFIRMYGLPSYHEMDPTILIGLTYSILFGFMFGDVGQGLCLVAGGLVLYKKKKASLAAILSCCGFFSTIFGFLFGSVFGFENLIPALWLRPMEQMTTLPFIGKLNTVFVVAIALGMGIILLSMVLNIINSFRAHEAERTYFDTNGIAGLVFYASLVATILLYMTGQALPATAVLVVMFAVPLLVIFFKEPLAALVERKAKVMPDGKGMFLVQGVFELFEVLLSYFSNTLSFVRVGAFAVSHGAMMEVVLMLSGAEAGRPNWIVILLGNLFVCGLEGLVVGIQVLRLEYYELFSRFYRGNGKAFRPYGKTN